MSVDGLFLFSLRSSWFLVWRVIFDWSWVVTLQDSGSCLKLMFYHTSSDTPLVGMRNVTLLVPCEGRSPHSPLGFLWQLVGEGPLLLGSSRVQAPQQGPIDTTLAGEGVRYFFAAPHMASTDTMALLLLCNNKTEFPLVPLWYHSREEEVGMPHYCLKRVKV